MSKIFRFTAFVAVLLVSTGQIVAAPKLLNGKLTALGSEPSGNKAGTIPAWTGGITRPPAGYVKGQDHIDPFAADKPLFAITAKNVNKYKDKLSALHRNLFRTYPDSYKMQVYRTRRSCALPDYVYEATRKNLKQAKLTDDGNNVEGALMGVPFPSPKTAVEVYWNHNLHFRGHKYEAEVSGGTVHASGSIDRFRRRDRRLIYYSDPKMRDAKDLNNEQFQWRMDIREPVRTSGMIMSMTNTINQLKKPRHGIMYDPGRRKITRPPPGATRYDSPLASSGGMRLSDDLFIFNGAPDRYSWKLKGKKEFYIPYNVYAATTRQANFAKFLKSKHLEPSFIRYELHRVWVLEATLKPQFNHKYHRRVFYVDEDSWIMTMADLYDKADKLITGQVAFIKNYYELPACVQDFDVLYDFPLRRYYVDNFKNEFGPADYDADIGESDFGLGGVKRSIKR